MPRLYQDPRSGNCYKCTLTASHLGKPLETVNVDVMSGLTRTPAFLARNPNGRVPLLELDDGTCLAESNAIIWYLAEGSPLIPTDPLLRAQMLPLMRALPPRLLVAPPPGPSGPWLEIATAEGLLAEVLGAAPFVDARVVPFRATFVVADRERAFRAMQDNPVMGALLRQCDEAELANVRDAVMDSFTEVAGGVDAPLLLDSACNILVATRR